MKRKAPPKNSWVPSRDSQSVETVIETMDMFVSRGKAATEKRNPYLNPEYGFLFSVAVFLIQENHVPLLSD